MARMQRIELTAKSGTGLTEQLCLPERDSVPAFRRELWRRLGLLGAISNEGSLTATTWNPAAVSGYCLSQTGYCLDGSPPAPGMRRSTIPVCPIVPPSIPFNSPPFAPDCIEAARRWRRRSRPP